MPLVKHPTFNAQNQKLEAHLVIARLLRAAPGVHLKKTSTAQSWNVTWNQQYRSKRGATSKAGMSFRINKRGATSKARKRSFLAGMCLESADIESLNMRLENVLLSLPSVPPGLTRWCDSRQVHELHEQQLTPKSRQPTAGDNVSGLVPPRRGPQRICSWRENEVVLGKIPGWQVIEKPYDRLAAARMKACRMDGTTAPPLLPPLPFP